MTKVTKQQSTFDIISRTKTLREMKTVVDNTVITTKDQAVDLINMTAVMDYAKKKLKPQATAHLDQCVDCEEHTSRGSGLAVTKVRRGKVWNTTPEIQKLEEDIEAMEDTLSEARTRLKFLREMAGYSDTKGHYWKAKL